MLRLTLLVLLVCLTGIAVGFPMSDDSDGSGSADESPDNDNGIDLSNGTCIEKAERVLKYLWEQYKVRHGHKFSSREDHRRIAIFKELLEKIQMHNREADIGKHSFHMGLNALSHLTQEEFAKMKGFISDARRSSKNEFRASMPLSALPTNVDWRQQGWVTPVKNQGQCGSCYTFATTGSLEGQLMNTTGTLVSLSEQNLVDCSVGKYQNQPNLGCNGGITDVAFQYVKKNGGIATEASYPYTGTQGSCRYSTSTSATGATVKGWIDVQSGSEAALAQAVATIGPTTVAIDAGSQSFQMYNGGIYKCTGSIQLDHAVLVVGYTPTYWIVKNSWGPYWGMQGYLNIARGQGNVANCGIATQASVAYMK